MKTYSDLDKRQKGLVKILREVAEPGEAKVDVVLQAVTFQGGISAALRSEDHASHEATGHTAVCVIDCSEKTPYAMLRAAAVRHGTTGIGIADIVKNLVYCLSKLGGGTKRPVCLVLDHAGRVTHETQSVIYRACDEIAFRLDLSVRIVLVITRIQGSEWRIDAKTGKHKRVEVERFRPENLRLQPRMRVWKYDRERLSFEKAPAQFIPVLNETPLLDQKPEAAPAIRIA